MDKPKWMLARKEQFGSVYQCDCGCFHLQLTRESYCELVDLINTSAANFELERHVNGSDDPIC